ncbi:MAG: hypothetical protein ACTSU5_17145, partial [Promethearchaeota archaeon]
ASQGGFPPEVRATVLKVANPKYALHGNDYEIPAVVELRQKIRGILKKLALLDEIKEAMVHIGKYLAGIDPTGELIRILAGYKLGELSAFSGVLDSWLVRNRGRLTTWRKMYFQDVADQVDDIKALLFILQEKLKEGRFSEVARELRAFPLEYSESGGGFI